ncbi:hypothetical protein O0L34_g12322 [Tuta absoluta]|nr:hypothetical protein O0L34_g12322 [Tuta absoluta]
MSNSSLDDTRLSQKAEDSSLETIQSQTGLHFLSEKADKNTYEETEDKDTKCTRSDLLEYMMRNDGSVVCKICGEILQSRTHWYRHKYKVHVTQPLNPAPLFQCEQCLVYFKSRKGYIGHIASRHSETLSDFSPVLTNTQAEAAKEMSTLPEPLPPEKEEPEPDPEMSIPRTCVLNYQMTVGKPPTPGLVVKSVPSTKAPEVKKPTRRVSKDSTQLASNTADLEEKRSREEKLVADIIDRVRRECEAQGSGGGTRRGYTRRYTVMHT